jgi:hypothetical protein
MGSSTQQHQVDRIHQVRVTDVRELGHDEPARAAQQPEHRSRWQARTIPTNNNLQLWIIDTEDSKHDMWLAFDTVGFDSALILNG